MWNDQKPFFRKKEKMAFHSINFRKSQQRRKKSSREGSVNWKWLKNWRGWNVSLLSNISHTHKKKTDNFPRILKKKSTGVENVVNTARFLFTRVYGLIRINFVFTAHTEGKNPWRKAFEFLISRLLCVNGPWWQCESHFLSDFSRIN